MTLSVWGSLLGDTFFKAMTCGDVCGAHPYLHTYVATVVIQLHSLVIYLVALLQGPEVRTMTPFFRFS